MRLWRVYSSETTATFSWVTRKRKWHSGRWAIPMLPVGSTVRLTVFVLAIEATRLFVSALLWCRTHGDGQDYESVFEPAQEERIRDSAACFVPYSYVIVRTLTYHQRRSLSAHVRTLPWFAQLVRWCTGNNNAFVKTCILTNWQNSVEKSCHFS